MPLPNLDKIPEEFKTAREIGLAAASLGALARRGLVEVLDTTPKQYRRVSGSAARVYQLCEENKSDYDTYFSHNTTNIYKISANTRIYGNNDFIVFYSKSSFGNIYKFNHRQGYR